MENEIISTLLNAGGIELTETSVLDNVLLQAEERILPAVEAVRAELLERAKKGEKLMNFNLRKGSCTKKWSDEAKAIEVAKTIGCDITMQKAKTFTQVKKEFGDFIAEELEKQGCIVNVFTRDTLIKKSKC